MATPAELVQAYGREYDVIRRELRRLTSDVWRDVGGPGDGNIEALLQIILPIMSGVEMNIGQLVAAYLDELSTEWGITITPIVTPDQVTGAVLRNGTPPEEVYARPITETRRALAKGKRIERARVDGRRRLQALADTDAMLAHRLAAGDAFHSLGFERYRRVPTARSCDLCRTAAENIYNAAYLMPIHGNCDCRIVPVYPPANVPQRELPKVPPPSAPADPVVREHGELGPVLVDRAHVFTGPGDLDL